MEDISKLVSTTLTALEAVLYNNTAGAIVRTVVLYNANATAKEVTIKLDNLIIYKLNLAAEETKAIADVVVTNNIKAVGEGVNIHISGIQLESA